MSKRVVSWFVYPLNPITNQRISEMLDHSLSMTEIRCAEGKRRPVWQCDKEFVSLLRNNPAMKIWVYKLMGDGRVIRDMGKDRIGSKLGNVHKLKAHLERMKPKRRPSVTTAS